MLWGIKTKNSELVNFDHDQLSKVVVDKQSPQTSSESINLGKKVSYKSSLQQLLQKIQFYEPQSKYIDMKTLKASMNVAIKKYSQCIYFGQIREGKRQGIGVMLYSNGRIYEGHWRNNFKQIKGYEKFPNLSIYQGAYQKGKPHGYGKYEWENGQIYQGQWIEGLKSGSGIWRGSKGDSYIGEWRQGKADGYGVHTWINGNRYEGQFKQCLKHGQGIQRFSNGDTYKGYYLNGKPDGQGEYFWTNGSSYKGQFNAGLRNGKGIWRKSIQQPCDLYQGQYFEQKKQGYGIFTWADGSKYIGNFKNDLRDGYGQMYWKDGTSYKGQWQNGAQIEQILQPINLNLQNSIPSQDMMGSSFLQSRLNQNQMQFINPEEYNQFQQFEQPNHPQIVELKKFRARGMANRLKSSKNQRVAVQIGGGLMVCNNFVTEAVHRGKPKSPVRLNKRPSRLSFNSTNSGNYTGSTKLGIKHSQSTSEKKAMSASFYSNKKSDNKSFTHIPIKNFQGVEFRNDYYQGDNFQQRGDSFQMRQNSSQLRHDTSQHYSSGNRPGTIKIKPRVVKSSSGVRNIHSRKNNDLDLANRDLDMFWNEIRKSRNAVVGGQQDSEEQVKWFTRSKNKSQYF